MVYRTATSCDLPLALALPKQAVLLLALLFLLTCAVFCFFLFSIRRIGLLVKV